MITRMTTSMMANNTLASIQQNFTRLADINKQMSSGKRMAFPSDDPASSVSSMRLRKELAATEQYKRNIDDANSWMQTADSAMMSVSTQYRKAKSTLINSVNSANGPASLRALGQDLRQQAQAIMAQTNATYLGRSVFAGNSDKGAAFKASIDGNGDTLFVPLETDEVTKKPVERRINADTILPANMDGNQIFGTGTVRWTIAKSDGTVKQLVSSEKEVIDPHDFTKKIKIPVIREEPLGYQLQAGETFTLDFDKIHQYQEDVSKKIAQLGAIKPPTPQTTQAIRDYEAALNTVKGAFLPDDPGLKADYEKLGTQLHELDGLKEKLAQSKLELAKKDYKDLIAEKEKEIAKTRKSIGEREKALLPDFVIDTSNNPSVMNLMVSAAQIMETGDLSGAKVSQIAAIQTLMDAKAEKLNESQSELGARHKQVLEAQDTINNDILSVKSEISGVEDIDIQAATIDMALASMAYQASLSSTQRVVQPSLLDYLR